MSGVPGFVRVFLMVGYNERRSQPPGNPMTTASTHHDSVRAVEWRDDALMLLDQRRLPGETALLRLENVPAVVAAIRNMSVRGAPAIGVTAAYAMVLAARAIPDCEPAGWLAGMEAARARLAAARPTAVNLEWALAAMMAVAHEHPRDQQALLAEARRIHEADIAGNRRMGELGSALIEPGRAVLTHCNTGALATGGYGTALGVIRAAAAAGKITEVLVDETRPWLQGARLTAWELHREGVPARLIVDSAAPLFMASGDVGWVIVGADRVAANGDVANKIGTYALAVAARYHGIGFMVVAPTSTVDLATATGADIPIEQRDGAEVFGDLDLPASVAVANPAFDVTPAALVDVLVTERGVLRMPDTAAIAALMSGPGVGGV